MKRYSILFPAAVVVLFGASVTEAAKLYYADCEDGGAIRCIDTATLQDEVVIDASLVDMPYFVAVHPDGGKIYWSEPRLMRIRRANLDATDIETVVTWDTSGCLFESGVLAIDEVNEKLYWSVNERLMQANLDGSNKHRVFTVAVPIYALDVHPETGHVYIGCAPNVPAWVGRIVRVDLDGANPLPLLVQIDSGVYGLVADVPSGHLYYSRNDSGPQIGQIERINLDGSAQTLILENNDVYALELDSESGKLYWSIWYRSTAGCSYGIARANLDGSGVETLPVARVVPLGMDLVHWPDCPEDLNGDNVVNLSDLANLLAHYGTTTGALPEDGDIDGDGDVDLSDLAQLLSAYGSICG